MSRPGSTGSRKSRMVSPGGVDRARPPLSAGLPHAGARLGPGGPSRGGLDIDALVPEHSGRVGGRLADVLVLQLRIVGPELLARAALTDDLQDPADREAQPADAWLAARS
jgi:hypothetical protein